MRKNLLRILEPLKGAGLEVNAIQPGVLAPNDAILVSTLNVAEFENETPKLGECCMIHQQIEIQVIMTAKICPENCQAYGDGPEDKLDEIEERLWPYLNEFIMCLKKEWQLDATVLADDVDLQAQEGAKVPFMQRSISLLVPYKYSMETPDRIAV